MAARMFGHTPETKLLDHKVLIQRGLVCHASIIRHVIAIGGAQRIAVGDFVSVAVWLPAARDADLHGGRHRCILGWYSTSGILIASEVTAQGHVSRRIQSECPMPKYQ